MRLPNQFPQDAGLKPVIVTDNGYKEAGSKQGRQQPDNTVRLIDPIRGPNFDTKQTQNNIKLKHACQSSLETFDAPPENGSMGLAFGTTGDPNMCLAFVFDNLNNTQSSPGNFSPMTSPFILQAALDQLGKVASKGYKETTRDGAKVRVPNDGEEWRFDLTKGLPAHAAINGLNGTIIPEIKQIATAIQQFGTGMSPSILSKLPGKLMSLSSLFNSLSQSQKNKIKENMLPEVANAFESMTVLYQSEDDTTADVVIGSRVDPDIFTENAVDLLSKVRTLNDLVDAFYELSSNSQVRGTDSLGLSYVEAETMNGTIYLTVDADGELELDGFDANSNVSLVTITSVNYIDDANVDSQITSTQTTNENGNKNKNVLQAAQKFASLLGNGIQNTGTTFKDNMWKDQAKKMGEVMGRIPSGSKRKSSTQASAAVNSRHGSGTHFNAAGVIAAIFNGKWFS